MRTERLFKSTGVRLSFIYSGLLVASFSLAISLTWIAARSAVESDLRDRIALEIEALKAEIRDEGIDAAVAAIAARAERHGAMVYWLYDKSGKVLSGDPAMISTPDGWHYLGILETEAGAEVRNELLVLTASMPDGSRLSVGDDLRRTESVRDAVLRALLWIGTATVALGILAGVIATRRSLKQMDALTSTMHEVANGRLDARVSLRGHKNANDLDSLGNSVNQMLDHIDRLIRNLRRVSSDVAHDLRTPLSHVKQRLETAVAAKNPADRLAYIEAAGDKIEEVLGAFDAILRLAEIEAGAAKSRFESVDVAATMERLADAYQPDIEASGRRLSIGSADAGVVHGDSELLAQALANLIENAIRHTPPGTVIRLSTVREDRSVKLIVADNGPGIPADRRADVLQSYRRLDESRSVPGFGLGLSIVAAIARLHDAQLELVDESPGLRVTLVFPAAHGGP